MSTFKSLLEPGHVYELRVPNTNRATVAGYFADFDALEAAATELDEQGPAVYFTLNPVLPDLLGRANNRVKPYTKVSTADTQIVRRLWLPLDFDAKRPAGISSTDLEHKAALDRATQVAEWLTEAGWPTPVIGDSGNGAHLLYRIDLPNDADSTKLVESVIRTIADRFDDAVDASPRIVLDRKVFNAARIWKAYGTKACKGDSTEDRPHRLAQILSMPDQRQIVTRDQLEALAAGPAPIQESDGYERLRVGTSIDLEEWIKAHAPEGALRDPKLSPDMEGGDKRTWEFHECPFNAEHKDGSAFVSQLSNGALSAGCHHDSCTWGWADLRTKWEPDRQEQPPPPIKVVREYRRKWDADDLAESEIPEVETLPLLGHRGYIGLGYSTLIGAYPKVGKTTLLVSAIEEWLGLDKKVLFFTEEPAGLWKPRVQAMKERVGALKGRFTLILGMGMTRKELLYEMYQQEEHVVLMDTMRAHLQFLDENDNAEMQQKAQPWIQAGRETGATFLGLHHTRKSGGEHGMAFAGASALFGLFDQGVELNRTSVANKRQVSGLGRLGNPPGFRYEMNGAGLLVADEWSPVGPARDTLQEILGLLEADRRIPGAEKLASTKGWSRDETKAAYQKLKAEGRIRSDGKGYVMA